MWFRGQFNTIIILQDGLLHSIKEEYVEGVEVLLEWEENHHIAGEPYVSINYTILVTNHN